MKPCQRAPGGIMETSHRADRLAERVSRSATQTCGPALLPPRSRSGPDGTTRALSVPRCTGTGTIPAPQTDPRGHAPSCTEEEGEEGDGEGEEGEEEEEEEETCGLTPPSAPVLVPGGAPTDSRSRRGPEGGSDPQCVRVPGRSGLDPTSVAAGPGTAAAGGQEARRPL